jgi:hypothetical protein
MTARETYMLRFRRITSYVRDPVTYVRFVLT